MNTSAWIIAHRGASAYAPENSLPAFELAWQMDADGIEGDFRLTADGQVICIHDATTGRTANANLEIAKTNYAQLRALCIHAHSKSTHIPLLSEVLATIPTGKKIFIEIKCGPEIVAPLLKVLNKSALQPEQITLFSFDITVLRTLKKANVRYARGLIVDFSFSAEEQISPSLATILTQATELGCATLHIGAKAGLPTDLGNHTRAHGLELHTWTVDTPALSAIMQQLGVRSLTTNKPDLIRTTV